ncbi:two-component system sensor histidine kinase NtrB [Ketogulonicigenium vulgare]|uniref:histidine kinase n=1 Tax=Ketogulonicigenium vulgare (strain WSH-001) TaxID=759362 RepID=F9Y508_KETVW|nr:ATP-binding protein [Ketogulonicigenium vulgare]ADO42441.1 nitrogen regulation protein NtrB [Ketogulonicigenium vulgare Y25]AEM40640.1 Sensor protein [Ketogulonicigenium vulgare WSH-001]ALJ80813.1 PAS domain-containing sensor histidine kinase [Ketogulonicigenium vulgare]ANW33593.1 PAS domain-containing sensor histidine kinase [Ketogulonicigenium vulgare]AOZ54354.1 nitrogen regulation protein NtrB [Ketogulonicigenium vulgare]
MTTAIPLTGIPDKDSALWSSLPVAALLLDESDHIQEINPAAEAFLNISARALRDAPVWDKVMVDAPLEEAFARARKYESSLFVNDVDVGSGERPPALCNIYFAPLQGSPGKMLMLISPREISHRMTQKNSSVKAAKSAIGMAEMLAHEIKNPLAGITGAAQLLSMGLEGSDIELTDLIVEESRRIVKLLEQVEQFGNLRPPARKPVNIHDILDRARQSASVGFGAHMMFLEEYDPSLPRTYIDPDQMLQVFLNLLKNASEAGQPGGSIRIHTFYEPSLRVRRPDGNSDRLPLQVEIIDDGPGLPPDIADDIFEPFVSGRENGTGLGLALVSKLVTAVGGWISVESIPGRTVFRVSLPLVPKEATDLAGEE